MHNVVQRMAPLVGIAPRKDGDVMIEELLVEMNKSAEGRQLASN